MIEARKSKRLRRLNSNLVRRCAVGSLQHLQSFFFLVLLLASPFLLLYYSATMPSSLPSSLGLEPPASCLKFCFVILMEVLWNISSNRGILDAFSCLCCWILLISSSKPSLIPLFIWADTTRQMSTCVSSFTFAI